ncbi:hypothetical protein ACJVDH_12125 [Pedobacter sp. AW1-32]|uniref:hypothetical protein n=1 Tax=Pedobacter sp. AW1-32 TaxID=3383026 RepID=UPI003FED3DED
MKPYLISSPCFLAVAFAKAQEINWVDRFNIGRTDVIDNRVAQYPDVNKLFTEARLPIGHFNFKTRGKIQSSSLKLDVYNTSATGPLLTVLAVMELMVVNINCKGHEEKPTLDFRPERSIRPRYLQDYVREKPQNFLDNPPIQISKKDGFQIRHQALLNGGGYSTIYKCLESKNTLKAYISIGYDGNTNMNPSSIFDDKGYKIDFKRSAFEGKNIVVFQTSKNQIIEKLSDSKTNKGISPVSDTQNQNWA